MSTKLQVREISQKLASCRTLLPKSSDQVHKVCLILHQSLDKQIRQGKFPDNIGLMAEIQLAIEEFEIKHKDLSRNGNLIQRQRHILASLKSEYNDIAKLICEGNESLRTWVEWLMETIGIAQEPAMR